MSHITPECKYHIAICFCVRNCGSYLERIFQNIKLLTDNKAYKISCIFVYDNCSDNSEQLLMEYGTNSNHDVYLKHIDNTSPLRTVRIATARNACLDVIYNELTSLSHHIIADCDDINMHSWNIDTIHKYITNYDNDDWDSISFNRQGYYDIWALLIDDFKHHCWGFGDKSDDVVDTMRRYIIDRLNNSAQNSIYCLSAFNGFAIYKTEKFKGIRYDGTYNNMKALIPDDERENTIQVFKYEYSIENIAIHHTHPQCCEHIFYHLTAAHKNKCTIKISKFSV